MRSRYIPGSGKPALCSLAAAMLLCACAEPSAPPAIPPKPVKIEVAGNSSLHAADRFVGTLRARQRTDLSFESPGRIAAIKVDVGDRVRAGQLLAQLDDAPARWRLAAAQAEREAAATILAERQINLRQQEALERDAIISPVALQAARSSYKQAASQHEAAVAAVSAARRDLALTRITAPFDGEIAARHAQPFVDVAAGHAILHLESGSAKEVVVMLPDAIAAGLEPGAVAHAVSGKHKLALKLERLSGRSDNGSLVQAVFRIPEASPPVRSGAAVSVELARQGGAAMTLPATALIPAADAGRVSVFVVDKGILARRAVDVDKRLLADGRVAIKSGLRNGEQVVVAGTAFLHDGQPVAAHQPQSSLAGARR